MLFQAKGFCVAIKPYQAGGRGFASWPATKWPWAHELSELPDVHSLDIHRGKTILLSDDLLALVDPVCRAELARMEREDAGWARLLAHLADTGPSVADDVEVELGLKHKELRALRSPLQRCGALVARSIVLPAASGEGHVHRSELARWDQASTGSLDNSSPRSLDNSYCSVVPRGSS